MSKIALITGITGQDGAYLADYLIKEKKYKVFGSFRRSSSMNLWRIEELDLMEHPSFNLIEHDLTDLGSSIRVLDKCKPDEVYNLAAQSFVGVSFDQPITTSEITGLGVLNLLEAIRIVNTKIKFYQASSSEMFGKVQENPQSENTPFYPRSPYGVSKLYAHWMTINYRESYGIFGASGILFNHESPLRGKDFVTRKISDSVAQIYLGNIDKFSLGNLNSRRDWGFALDYVKGMHMMLQAKEPDTFVLATGNTYSIRDFLSEAFKCLGREIVFEGSGLNEIGIDSETNKRVLEIDSNFFRPSEVDILKGNYDKANKVLGWKPETNFESLVQMMVESDIKRNS